MIRHLLRPLFLLLVRLGFAALILLLVVEFVLRDGGRASGWPMSFELPLFVEGAGKDSGWREVRVRAGHSGLVLAMAFGVTLAVGYGWGIFAARFRRFRLGPVIALPFHLLSCAPGFWLVLLIAIHVSFHWGRPGFADELVVESGPDLMRWWNAMVVALSIAPAAVAWQFRTVYETLAGGGSGEVGRELYLAGYGNDEIFYGNLLRRRVSDLVRLLDGTLPALTGALVVSEWAFRYDGMGSLLVESLKTGSGEGVFLSGMWLVLVTAMGAALREIALGLSTARARAGERP